MMMMTERGGNHIMPTGMWANPYFLCRSSTKVEAARFKRGSINLMPINLGPWANRSE